MTTETEDQGFVVSALLEQKNLEQKLKITQREYRFAVTELLELAFKDCGGARFAAQALLSLYDGEGWKADLTGICCGLDSKHFHNVLIALKGRALLMLEPHTIISDGEKEFRALAQMWTLPVNPATGIRQ